jgi:hypothetical protein
MHKVCHEEAVWRKDSKADKTRPLPLRPGPLSAGPGSVLVSADDRGVHETAQFRSSSSSAWAIIRVMSPRGASAGGRSGPEGVAVDQVTLVRMVALWLRALSGRIQ